MPCLCIRMCMLCIRMCLFVHTYVHVVHTYVHVVHTYVPVCAYVCASQILDHTWAGKYHTCKFYFTSKIFYVCASQMLDHTWAGKYHICKRIKTIIKSHVSTVSVCVCSPLTLFYVHTYMCIRIREYVYVHTYMRIRIYIPKYVKR